MRKYFILIIIIISILILQKSFTIDFAADHDLSNDDSSLEVSTTTRQIPITIEKFSDGSSFMELGLTTLDLDGLYHNTTATVTIPKNAQIQSASFEIEGLSTPIVDNVIKTIDYTDPVRTAAYAGQVYNDPPTEPLKDLKMMYEFNSVHRTNISSWDGLNVSNSSAGIGSHGFHLFQVNLSGEQFGAINFSWVGHGAINTTPYQYGSKIFYWTGAEFKILSVQTGGGGSDANVFGMLDEEDMLDTYGNIHIIVISPAGTATGTGIIYSNYVEVQTLKNGTGLSFPYNVSFDVGDTGSYHSKVNGELKGQAVVTQGLTTAFQAAVDAAGNGYGSAVVPVHISSEHAGNLNITGLELTYVLDVRPELVQAIPNGTAILEDSGWSTSTITLTDHFHDSYGGSNLSFEVVYKEDASEVDCRVAPGTSVLEFYTDSDFYGTSEFRVTARNRGDDGIAGNADDRVTDSNQFQVTVLPTNDAPNFDRLEFPGGHTKPVSSDSIKLIITGERAQEDIYYTMNVTARDIDGDTPVFSCNISDGIGDDDIAGFTLHPLSGKIEFTPTNAHIGMLYFNISVTDYNGSTPLFDYLDVELLVDDRNDVPVILTEGPLDAYEDTWNYYQIDTFDEEGSKLIYRSNLTDGKGFDDRDDLTLNRDTGQLALYPEQDDVGGIWLNVSVEDEEGAFGYRDIQIVVHNVNDVPVITNVGGMAVVKNDHLLFEVEEGGWLNLTLTARDEDGDTLSFAAMPLSPSISLPEGLSINKVNGSVSYHAGKLAETDLDPDNHFINISTSDPGGGTDFVWLEIQVNRLNRPPVIGGINYTINQGRVTFTISAHDPEGDEVKILWDFGDGSQKVTSYGLGPRNHTYAGPGNYSVTIQVIDVHDDSSTTGLYVNLTEADFPAAPGPGKTKDDEGISAGLIGGIIALVVCIVIFIVVIFFIIRKKKDEYRRSREEVKRLLDESRIPPKPVQLSMDEGMKEAGESREDEEAEKKGKQTTLARFGDIFSRNKE